MSAAVFDRYAEYYDLLYGDKDYTAEAEYVARAVRELTPAARSLLEFGSGTGKHGRLLARHGFDVTGIERSEAMVAASTAVRSDARFTAIVGDIRATRLNRTFDAVLSLFHVVSYQTSDDELVATFANAARHLDAGGLFLFDIWHGPAVLAQQPTARVKRVENDSIRLSRTAEPELDTDAHVVTVHYTIDAESKTDGTQDRVRETHVMRYLFPAEIHDFANRTGFDVIRSEEMGTGRAPSDGTWGVAYVLRKRAR